MAAEEKQKANIHNCNPVCPKYGSLFCSIQNSGPHAAHPCQTVCPILSLTTLSFDKTFTLLLHKLNKEVSTKKQVSWRQRVLCQNLIVSVGQEISQMLCHHGRTELLLSVLPPPHTHTHTNTHIMKMRNFMIHYA